MGCMVIVLRKKLLAGIALCLAAVIAIPLLCFGLSEQTQPAAAANTNWGLSFPENGKTPRGNATADFLKQYDAYYCGGSEEKFRLVEASGGLEAGPEPARPESAAPEADERQEVS